MKFIVAIQRSVMNPTAFRRSVRMIAIKDVSSFGIYFNLLDIGNSHLILVALPFSLVIPSYFIIREGS